MQGTLGCTSVKMNCDDLRIIANLFRMYSSVFAGHIDSSESNQESKLQPSPSFKPMLDQEGSSKKPESSKELVAVTAEKLLRAEGTRGKTIIQVDWMPADIQLFGEAESSRRFPLARIRTRFSSVWLSDKSALSVTGTVALDLENNLGMHASGGPRWEPVVEPWMVEGIMRIEDETDLEVIEVRSNGLLEVSLAPEHVQALSVACDCISKIWHRDSILYISESKGRGKQHRERQHHGDELDIVGVLKNPFTFVNSTDVDLELEASPSATGISYWKCHAHQRSTVQIPFAHLESGQLRLCVSTGDSCGQWVKWPQACSWEKVLTSADTLVSTICLPVTYSSSRVMGNAVWVELTLSRETIVVRIPWKVHNMLPVDMELCLWEEGKTNEPEPIKQGKAEEPCIHDIDGNTQLPDKMGEYSVNDSQGPVFQITLQPGTVHAVACNLARIGSLTLTLGGTCTGLAPVHPSVRLSPGISESNVEFVDKSGRHVTVRIIVLSHSAVESGHPIQVHSMNVREILVCPHVVLVNWTGLPLIWGRCRSSGLRVKSSSSSTLSSYSETAPSSVLSVEIAAGQEYHHQKGHNCNRFGDGAATQLPAGPESPAWSAKRPDALIFSMSEEQGWVPCVAICSEDDRDDLKWIPLLALESRLEVQSEGDISIAAAADEGRGRHAFEIVLPGYVCKRQEVITIHLMPVIHRF